MDIAFGWSARERVEGWESWLCARISGADVEGQERR